MSYLYLTLLICLPQPAVPPDLPELIDTYARACAQFGDRSACDTAVLLNDHQRGNSGVAASGRVGCLKRRTPMTTDPHALVQPGSEPQKGLFALGWTTTDHQDGWDHMEPPTGRAVVIANQLMEPDEDAEPEDDTVEVTLRERLDLHPTDMIIVTAEDCDASDIEKLRDQVDALLAGEQDAIIANFDITVQAIRPVA